MQHPGIKVRQLKMGDDLVTRTGSIQLRKIGFKIFKGVVVYDLQLDGSHDYYADGLLVHNRPGHVGYTAPTVDDNGNVTKQGLLDDICVTNGTGC